MDILADGASIASASMVSVPVAAAAAPEKNKKKKTTRGKKKRSPKLPVQLMQLLNEGSHPKALWWLPGEKDFAINADVFPSEVLEVYFPGTKYASFIRQLHKLGFARETRALKKVHSALARHTVAFSHECFQRDQPELMEQIRNINTKAGKAKKVMGKNNKNKSPLVAPVSPLESPVVPPAIIETASPAIPYVPAMSAPEAIPSIPQVQKPDAGSFHPMHMQQQLQHDPSVNDDAALLLSLQILRQQREAEEQERQLQLILMQQRRQQEELELQQLLAQQQQEMELQHLLRQQQQQQAFAQPAYANPYHHPDAFVSSTTTAQDPLMRYLSAALDTSAAPSPYHDQLLSYQQALAQQQQQQFNPFSPNANYSLGNFF